MSSMCIIDGREIRRTTLLQVVTPNILSQYNDPQNTIVLVHFVKSDITRIGLYDMLEHEVYPWTIDYETLETDYHDNLQFVMNLWKKHKSAPDDMDIEDVVIWVGFRSNPGFWYGKVMRIVGSYRKELNHTMKMKTLYLTLIQKIAPFRTGYLNLSVEK